MTHRSSERPHFCIVLLTGLGDVVHGLPLVNALRDRHPEALITWVVEPMPSAILQGHPAIDNLVTYRRSEGVRGIRDLKRQLDSLPRPDITLNLNVYFKSVWPTILSRAPRRIGFDKTRSFEGVWLASNERLEPKRRAHTADMFLEFADHLRIPVDSLRWRVTLDERDRQAARDLLAPLADAPVATIIPASATPKKDWLGERWTQVAEHLVNDYGFNVVLAGGPGAREQAIARSIVEHAKVPITTAMGDSVRRMAAILERSNLVLAPDTGPVHIARAFEIPVIGLFGHTNPWRVGPWRAFSDLWVDRYTDPGERPDASNREPRWDRMRLITVNEVLEKVAVAAGEYRVLENRGGNSAE